MPRIAIIEDQFEDLATQLFGSGRLELGYRDMGPIDLVWTLQTGDTVRAFLHRVGDWCVTWRSGGSSPSLLGVEFDTSLRQAMVDIALKMP